EVDAVLRDRSVRVKDATLLDRTWPGWRAHRAATLQANAMVFDSTDGHTRVRRLLGRVFTPQRIAGLEPTVRALTGQLLDGIPEPPRLAFVSEFAYRLPSAVLCALLGVDQDEALWIRRRIDAVTVFLEPDARYRDLTAGDAAAEELSAHLDRLIAARRADPGD